MSAADAEVIYRIATEEELPVVAQLYEKLYAHFCTFPTFNFPVVENVGQVWLDSFKRTLGRFSQVYVAEYEGRIVGFMLNRIKRVAPYLGGVMVGELADEWIEPEVRRLGVGEALIRVSIDWMREQNVHSVEVHYFDGNDPIWRILQRVGFKQELHQIRYMFDQEEGSK